jgi:uncharacterized membrane protein YtjA (UPF0391 family)
MMAVLAGLLGFTGIAGTAAWIARLLSAGFLALFVVSVFVSRRRA